MILTFVLTFSCVRAEAFTLEASMPTEELVTLAKATQPELYDRFEKQFIELSQMCRHGHNMRYPNDLLKTHVKTPKVQTQGILTKHQALKQQYRLNKIGEHLLKKSDAIEFQITDLFPEKTCQHSLLNFSPESLIKKKLASQMQELKALISKDDFKGCAHFIEQRLGL